ncbi:DUF6259 domain-containing protein [Planctomyces sp. SH-PL62]|uniref:DUF6259 domain-containing protein n=1 Tax=Planctomyces sp. SH-PL62 TaxID=1636152 RepID=UPI00078B2ED9|nr:DUF6259 domain-containing protein [Planctomyces sp. SH-PL62]AMV40767.1 hypothetical protein VT85_25265 [Planctomyces sp. SH-PL62]
MLAYLLLLGMTAATPCEDLRVGYRREAVERVGPGDWREAVEPVWVYAYPTLRLRYRASGLPSDDSAVLTLSPGSVGPVTPGATNPENPFVAGSPVPAVLARDLAADVEPHTLDVDLRGRMRTPQIHELRFALPEGAKLAVEELTFLGGADLLPPEAGPTLPAGAAAWGVEGGADCGGWRGTTLRGRETLRVVGEPRAGGTLYLGLFPNFANVGSFAAGRSPEEVRVKESRETADLIVRLTYADGGEEEQYPLSVAERRHVLANRRPALYALELEPGRPLASAEIVDRSAHAQIFVSSAGVSDDPPPGSVETLPAAVARREGRPVGAAEVEATHRIVGAPEAAIEARPTERAEAEGRRLALELKNVGAEVREFTLTFPSATIRPSADAGDVAYVFPRQGAVIAREEGTLEAPYNAAFPLQFVDVFAPGADAGAALIVRDVEGRGKTFRLRKQGAGVTVEVDYRVRLEPGESWRAPEVSIAPHGGDWREGFAAYRAWVASWYRPVGPRPAWLRSAFWARRDYPVGGTGKLFDVKRGRYTFDALVRDGEAFGGVDFIDVSSWAMSETVGRVGDYPIELGGVDDLARNIAQARAQGVPTGLYFEGYLIDKRSKVGREQDGRWQLINEDGKGAWWSGGEATELFACPYVPDWRAFLARRVAEVAKDVGAAGVYLDEFGFGRMRCYAADHGHRPGVETLPGEIETARAVRKALDDAGAGGTMIYIEETPPDAAAPYFDAAFCYNFNHADINRSPLKLNLSRFAFPDVRLWDMVSIGIDPRVLPWEDFRLSLWHGNGLWLKGHAESWYGDDLLAWLRRAHGLLKAHAEAFAGPAEPLVDSPHPAVFINRFGVAPKVVHTLFNASYRTVRFPFEGRERTLAPRDVMVVEASGEAR